MPTKGGRTTSYGDDSGRSDFQELGRAASALSEDVHGLDRSAFPSCAAGENDLVAAGLQLLGSGRPDEVGTLTSSGTESCALAVLAARADWRARTGERHGRGEIVVAESVHPAFLTAAHLVDLDVVRAPVDPATYRADPSATRCDDRSDGTRGRLRAVLR